MGGQSASICFLLPGRLDRPIGGHKVVYQYANCLAEKGHSVRIVNCIFQRSRLSAFKEVLRRGYAAVRWVGRALRGRNTCRGWYPLAESVREQAVWAYDSRYMPRADYYVATDATTSPYLLDYPVPDDHKLYFIQGYENWRMTDQELRATWHYPYRKVVISRWLQRLLAEEGVDSVFVPNGFNPEDFDMTIPVKEKDAHCVTMLWHEYAEKNSKLGLAALEQVVARHPETKALIFGVYPRPENLPAYCTYYRSPDRETHNQLNNRAAIYIGTSNVEGWGLTVMEAMACGQAVACTDNAGYREMAEDDVTALLSPVGDANALADNILRLMEDDALRHRIAETGYQHIAQFSSERSNALFAALFE